MTDKEREIFRTDRPVDVQGLGDYLKGMTLDLNAYNDGQPKGIMFKHASSPSMQRLQNAIHKLANTLQENPAIYRTTETPDIAASSTKNTADQQRSIGVNYAQVTPQRPNTVAQFTEANNVQDKSTNSQLA